MDAEIVVPALALRDSAGRLDEAATATYAARGAGSWVDRFLLSGTTTSGHAMSAAERAAVLDVWLDLVPAERLVACCWTASDLETAAQRDVTPIVVMRNLPDIAVAERFLGELPPGSYVYSHPAHSPVLLDSALCARSRDSGTLPAGGKLARYDATTSTQCAPRPVRASHSGTRPRATSPGALRRARPVSSPPR